MIHNHKVSPKIPPRRLMLTPEGDLIMEDGSDVKAYLKEFASKRNQQIDLHVNVVNHEAYKNDLHKSWLYDNIILAA